jgi:hypothetical protein
VRAFRSIFLNCSRFNLVREFRPGAAMRSSTSHKSATIWFISLLGPFGRFQLSIFIHVEQSGAASALQGMRLLSLFELFRDA